MEQGFIDILKKLVKEQGKEALTDAKKCKAFLADYTGSEYKKERRFVTQAVEAGAAKAIAGAQDLAACKQAQVRELEDECGFSTAVAADIVDALALVLRGEEKEKNCCKYCGKELLDEWQTCPYCGTAVKSKSIGPEIPSEPENVGYGVEPISPDPVKPEPPKPEPPKYEPAKQEPKKSGMEMLGAVIFWVLFTCLIGVVVWFVVDIW
jgi:hypothetical protein